MCPLSFVRRMLNRRRGSSQRKGSLARDCPSISSARFALHSLHSSPCLVTPPVAAHIKMGSGNGPLKPWQPVSNGPLTAGYEGFNFLRHPFADHEGRCRPVPAFRGGARTFSASPRLLSFAFESGPSHGAPDGRAFRKRDRSEGTAYLHSIRSRPPATGCRRAERSAAKARSSSFRRSFRGNRTNHGHAAMPQMRPKSHSFRADRLFSLASPKVEHCQEEPPPGSRP